MNIFGRNMDKTKKYKNPPLTEAIFELFFQSSNWTPATPGMFYGLASKKYPVISQSAGGFGISLGSGGLQIGAGNNNLTQFKSQDSSSIVQLSNNLLTVNKLPHYDGWESFREMIFEAVEYLNQVLDITSINRIGLKAINKIDIQSHNYENFKKYFKIYPVLPESVSTELNSIQLNLETPYKERNEVLATSLATLNKEPRYEAPILFQLYYTKLKDVDKNSIDKWIELAHERLHNSFENILTSECKSSFDHV